MDLIIDFGKLNSNNNSLSQLKSKSEQISNNYNSSYIQSVSGTEIGSLVSKTKSSIERLKKGYTNSHKWLSNYISSNEELESSLSSQSIGSTTATIEFKGKFEDIFSKRTIPAIKTGGDPNYNKELLTPSGNIIRFEFNGKTFYVVDTKIPVEQYAEYVSKNHLTQNDGLLGGDCMLLSQYYAVDMLRGTYTSRNTMANTQGGPATRINERARSTDVNEVLEYAYNEIKEGNPVVLQVSQIHSDRGARHLVTMVGFSSDVKSAADLTPDNILVLDCVDGKIQTLGQARSEGGHERRVFAQGGNYQALGPTETFKNKEVYTA